MDNLLGSLQNGNCFLDSNSSSLSADLLSLNCSLRHGSRISQNVVRQKSEIPFLAFSVNSQAVIMSILPCLQYAWITRTSKHSSLLTIPSLELPEHPLLLGKRQWRTGTPHLPSESVSHTCLRLVGAQCLRTAIILSSDFIIALWQHQSTWTLVWKVPFQMYLGFEQMYVCYKIELCA